jgi:flagellar biosynthesis protein FlhF
MKVAKYKAATMREALAQAKRELGESAIILSTREVRRGVIGAGIEITAVTEVEEEGDSAPTSPRGPSTIPPPPALAEADVERIMAPLRSELRTLQTMLRAGQPDGPGLRQELAELRRALADLATTAAPATPPPLEEVGPTGAGKTTTVAKLAARAALIRAQRVGIITLDDYRVGGEEQIRIFAELIPVPVHMATNRLELARALHALQECDLIYIDTSGRSPLDRQPHAELASTLSAVDSLEIHLVVPAPTAPTYIDRLAIRYQEALSIDRLLFTKLDEADDLGELVRAPARLELPISHVTTGQAVPEDLEDVDDTALLDMAIRNRIARPRSS